jgi:hypothetical protein
MPACRAARLRATKARLAPWHAADAGARHRPRHARKRRWAGLAMLARYAPVEAGAGQGCAAGVP